ncbi:MAG: mobilization protein MobD [Chromatiaceae bacterium]|nr:mobilization protein MobD [Chromatiaceae bacterium]MCP5434023.1 mobilization protein MobD [Chromatiaceae bacterium]
MSAIHFVGGEKGGVGKSLLSRLLSQYFLDRSMPYIGLDADQSHPTLSRYYGDFTRPINLDFFESTDQIMELALATEQNLVIDLPAQSQRFLDRWIEDNGILEMCADMQIPLVYWYVVDDGRDSVGLLDGFLTKYRDHLQCVVVKNQGRGTDFSEIEGLAVLNDTDSAGRLRQLTLPALHAATIRRIEKLNFSFWAAEHVKDGDAQHLSLMERQRTKVWVKKAYAMIDDVVGRTFT